MTIARYVVIVTMVYLVAVLTVIALVGDMSFGDPNDWKRLWPIPLAAIGISYLGTASVIARFGNATGSVYFLPTVVHAAVILVLAIAVAFGR